MLTLLFSTDWVAGRNEILHLVAQDVKAQKSGCILLVPELISHDMERRLCDVAGDTSSRFAEVLSFTRLARRVSDALNCKIPECLDNGGRLVAMGAAALQLHSKLKVYASVETKPEFLTELVDAVDEFKCCCISAADLRYASTQTKGTLAQKLEELALLLDAYDALCERGKRDPRDLMIWLLEELEGCNFAKEHRFYIDGFPDFTEQHMLILKHLIASGTDVVICMNCDAPNSKDPAFEKAGTTASALINCAKKTGTPYITRVIQHSDAPISQLGRKLFQGRISEGEFHSCLQTYRTESVYEECCIVADKILELTTDGVRYRDIGVVCGDINTYKSTLNMVFRRCKIPCYLSGTEDILDKSVLNTVLFALDAVLNHFDQRDMFRYLKSLLSPVPAEICDRIENYAIFWNINGNRWLSQWTAHPYDLTGEMTEGVLRELDRLNAVREKFMKPLETLHNGLMSAINLKQQVLALYRFLEEIQFAKNLNRLANDLEEQGDRRNVQIVNQIWEILMNALEQLYDVLGDTSWDSETFCRLFKLLLSQYNVGTIPTVLDAVTIGPVSAMRCQQTKHLFILGALEGKLPGYSVTKGILSDQDRGNLRKLGVHVNGGSVENIQVDFAEIYGVFNGASDQIYVLCPDGQPSYVYRRLSQMAGQEKTDCQHYGAALTDPSEAAAFLARWNAAEAANQLNIKDAYDSILARRHHRMGKIERKNIAGLYGDYLWLSASQIDKNADCRMAYFLKYGLKLRERKIGAVDSTTFGTYVHDVLENTGKKVMDSGGFKHMSLDDVLKIAIEYSDSYCQKHFSQIESERIGYLFRRNTYELELVVRELWQEMQTSEFLPVGFEVGFGKEEMMSAVNVSGVNMEAYLHGYVDRVDLWDQNGNQFFRVVDYKTGKKDFDYCDIYNGIGLQMLLYLFTLEENGKDLLGGTPRIAGVQYFPARVPLVTTDGTKTEKEVDSERESLWTRQGLILNDEDIFHAMDNTDSLNRLSCKRSKEGIYSGDIAERDQFKLLKTFVFAVVGAMVDDIASGNVEPNPYTRGQKHNACEYCPFGSVCIKCNVKDRRNFKLMNSDRFWEDVKKEVGENG